VDAVDDMDCESALASDIESHTIQKEGALESADEPGDSISDVATVADAGPATGKKMGKAAQKRAKKAAQQDSSKQTDLKFKCARCDAAFPSRTRLFQHIKDFGHAAPVPKSAKAAKGKGRK